MGGVALLVDLPNAKLMLAQVHVNQLADELDTFQLQPISLFDRGTGFQFYCSTGSDDPMPRQRIGRIDAQQARDRAVIQRIAGGRCDVSIRADFSDGNRKNNAPKSIIAKIIRLQSVDDDPALQLLFVKKPKPITGNLKTLPIHIPRASHRLNSFRFLR